MGKVGRKKIYFFVNDFGLTGSETLLSQFISDLSRDDRFEIFVVTSIQNSVLESNANKSIVFKSINKHFTLFDKLLFKLGFDVFKDKLKRIFGHDLPDIVYLNTINNAYLLPYLSTFPVIKILHIHELYLGLNSMSKTDFNHLIHLTDEIVTSSDLVTNTYTDIYSKLITQINSVPRYKNEEQKFIDNETSDTGITNKVKIACAGSICYGKGFDKFLEVASRLDPTKYSLHWFGKFDHSAYSELMKLKLKLPKFQHVFVESYPDQQSYLKALAKCNLFIFTSREESMGMVLFDALHYNLPILSFEEYGSSLILNKSTNKTLKLEDLPDIENIISKILATSQTAKQGNLPHFNYENEYQKFLHVFQKY